MKKILLTALCACISAFSVNAGVINIDYNGFFDESTIVEQDGLTAGDFDTLGGIEDVALFDLVAGNNEFLGSVYFDQSNPNDLDSSDVFLVGIGDNLRLIGATIHWAMNLPSLEFNFPNVPNGFLQQSTFLSNAPDWFFEESSVTPEIFTVSDLEASMVGSTYDVGPSFYTAPDFSREQGVYSSLLSASGTCAQSYRQVAVGSQIGLEAFCAAGIDYKMTFIVEEIHSQPPTQVPEPSSHLILALGLILLGIKQKKAKR